MNLYQIVANKFRALSLVRDLDFEIQSVYFGTVLFVKEEATVITNNGSIMGEGSWNLRSGRYCLPLSACVVGPQCILPMHFELGREGDEFDSRD